MNTYWKGYSAWNGTEKERSGKTVPNVNYHVLLPTYVAIDLSKVTDE